MFCFFSRAFLVYFLVEICFLVLGYEREMKFCLRDVKVIRSMVGRGVGGEGRDFRSYGILRSRYWGVDVVECRWLFVRFLGSR